MTPTQQTKLQTLCEEVDRRLLLWRSAGDTGVKRSLLLYLEEAVHDMEVYIEKLKSGRVFRVTYVLGREGLVYNLFVSSCTKDFTDVFEFLDWMRERTLNREKTIILSWEYADAVSV